MIFFLITWFLDIIFFFLVCMNKGINKKIILFIFKNYLFNIYKLLHLATFFLKGNLQKNKNKKLYVSKCYYFLLHSLWS